MFKGIGEESQSRCNVPSDCDNYRFTYKDYEQQINGTRVDVSFVSPVFSTWEKYRFCLLQSSKKVQMTDRYKYRPDYVSYDNYGTTNWWQLLMWLNDVKSLEYFDTEEIIVPTIEAISKVTDACYDAGGYIDLNEDAKHKTTLYTLFKNPVDKLNQISESEVLSNSGTSNTLNELLKQEEDTVFCREVFTMTIPILRLKYVQLSNEPIEKSVRLVANCRPNLIYGKHYQLVQNNDKSLNRISWDPNVVQNAGLLFKLRENDVLEVQYVKKQ